MRSRSYSYSESKILNSKFQFSGYYKEHKEDVFSEAFSKYLEIEKLVLLLLSIL